MTVGGVENAASWKALEAHYATTMSSVHVRDLFASDPGRFGKFHHRFEDLVVDYSKNCVTSETMALLRELAREADVIGLARRMFSGEKINVTENRAVLHAALRNRSGDPVRVDGVDVMPGVREVLSRIEKFVGDVRSGRWRGHTGKAIRAVVNIGIGGSDLGPVMVTEALRPYAKRDLEMHFCSNVDGTHVSEILRRCDPETTLFLVASKT
jgi:glucose-6-phosphate isomerase